MLPFQLNLLDLLLSLSELLQDSNFCTSELEEVGLDWSLLIQLRESEQQLRDRCGGQGVAQSPTPN